jgi:hypothetical protein
MNLLEVRDKLGAVLAPIDDDDPNVLTSLVDAIEPPALMLGWNEPWLEPEGMCFNTGHVVVTCVAARLSPGEGIAKLEELVAYTLRRLRTDTESWALTNVSGPRVFLIAKTNYLACRIALRVSISE